MDIDRLCRMEHRSCLYPHLAPVVFTEADRRHMHKDAIMFSGHKFVGGPGTSGVLVVKKELLPPSGFMAPTISGGGTVFYVTEEHQRYLANREEREEAGTPNILGDIRLGLVVNLKEMINHAHQHDVWEPCAETKCYDRIVSRVSRNYIERKEFEISLKAQTLLETIPNVVLLGRISTTMYDANQAIPLHLPVFSFLIRHNDHKYLHYSFVCALLNDLFGIQSRGGCQCAGPFSQQMLGLARPGGLPSSDANERFEQALLDKHEVLRPGYTRLSFPYWMRDEDIDYVLEAIRFVAEHGWKFLSVYK